MGLDIVSLILYVLITWISYKIFKKEILDNANTKDLTWYAKGILLIAAISIPDSLVKMFKFFISLF